MFSTLILRSTSAPKEEMRTYQYKMIIIAQIFPLYITDNVSGVAYSNSCSTLSKGHVKEIKNSDSRLVVFRRS